MRNLCTWHLSLLSESCYSCGELSCSFHSAEGMNAGGYGNLLMSMEQPQGEYSVTISFLNLVTTLVRVSASGVLWCDTSSELLWLRSESDLGHVWDQSLCSRALSVIFAWLSLLHCCFCFLWSDSYRKPFWLISNDYRRLEIACKSMSPCPVVFSRFKDNKEYLPPEVFLSPSWLNNISISPRDNLVAPRAKAWCPASCSFWRKCYQITTNGDTTLMEWERKLVRMLKGGVGGERNKRITCLIFSSSHLGFALYISWYC